MPKVLVLTSTFPRWEGDTVPPFVYQLSNELAGRGYEIHVLAPHAKDASKQEQIAGLSVHRFQYAPAPLESLSYGGGILENLRSRPWRWGLVPAFVASQAWAMLRLQNRYKFDLVHAHWLIPQGLTAGLVRRWIGAPMLLTAHGADVFASRSRLRKAAARFATSRHDAVTVNSTAMRRQLEQLTGAQADVIPMGVDIKNFGADPAKQSHSDAGPPTILFVGRLAEKKGVEYLVRAMPAIRAHVPGVRLVVVGDGPRRSALEDEVREAGVADAVSFEGAKPNANLPSYYRQADVFVAPSVVASDGDTEALGVVFLEAAACRLPIVATRVGGISDIVKHEETGLLVEQKSPTEIAGAVVRVLGDRLLARHMGQRARQHVEANFSWNVVADRFAEKYEMLLGAGATEDQATLKAA